MKILIAEIHPLIREGIKEFLKPLNATFIETDSGDKVPDLVNKHKPSIIVLSVELNNSNGLNALGRVRLDHSELPAVIFAEREIPQYVAQAISWNANGYITRDCSGKDFLANIEKALDGRNLFTREIMRRCTGALATPRSNASTEVPLTKREEEVLRNLSTGMTNKEIAEEMGISYETVKEHVQHLLRKVGVSDRTQAAVWAVRNQVV